MANKKKTKTILIEKRILRYINTRFHEIPFTTSEITNELKEFAADKYIKRNVWSILRDLTSRGIIEKTGYKQSSSDCYLIIDADLLKNRLNELDNIPLLVKKNHIKYKQPEQKTSLSALDTGKSVIAYVNSLEEKYHNALKKIETLELELLDYKISSSTSLSVDKISAGDKMFIFKD